MLPDELLHHFQLFDDWELRYQYLLDLGEALPVFPRSLKQDDYLVAGCTSRVWLVPRVDQGIFSFQATSDSHIVRGLLALLHHLFDGQSVDFVRQFDLDHYFQQLGLSEHLSATRQRGLSAVVARIKNFVSVS